MKRFCTVLVLATALFAAGCGGSDTVFTADPVVTPQPVVQQRIDNSIVLRWNQIAIDASGFDHSAAGAKEQTGPIKAARAIAIVHVAMHDALQAIQGRYDTYLVQPAVPEGASQEAAVAQAAHDTLCSMFLAQKPTFDQFLQEDLDRLGASQETSDGITVGQRAAALILTDRNTDNSDFISQSKPYAFGLLPGQWRVDPINPGQTPLGPNAGLIKTFVLNDSAQFRCPVPPALTSPEYTAAFNEVKALGGDGIVTPTVRTEDQTVAGIYWAYDGTPSLCAPIRLYDQIATQLAQERGLTDGGEMLQLLTLANLAMADAGLSGWESKFFYNYWRPVCGIREADPGTGPSGLGDGNPNTIGDPAFVPLCAPASNLQAPNFTPPFPAYPSGHATFGGALFQTLRNKFGTDDVPFTFVSDEYNGITRDNLGNVRPLIPRSFQTLSQAEFENGQSRIYLGIHWNFDRDEGIAQGNKVANFVFANALQPK